MPPLEKKRQQNYYNYLFRRFSWRCPMDERGLTYLGTLIAVAIAAIISAAAYTGIARWTFSQQEGTSARLLYRAWQAWTIAAIANSGADLSDNGTTLTVLSGNGYQRTFIFPRDAEINLNWTPFAGKCQALNGYGVPVISATSACAAPVISSTTTIPKLSACFAGGVCVGAHS